MPVAITALLLILMLSAVLGWLQVRRKVVERPVKIMMFVGYFWLNTFLQLLLVSGVYFLNQRFF